MATVADLGARALRKTRVSLVPQAARSAPAAPQSNADVAALAVRDLGIPIPEAMRPGTLGALSLATIAAAGLRKAGIGQASSEMTGIVQQAEVAAHALRLVSVNPADLGSIVPDMATFFNRAAIARRVLLKLSVIASDETPATADSNDVQDVVVSVHDSLVVKDYVTWSVDQIPERAAEHYVTMVANLVAPQYGKQGSLESYAAAEQMLRQEALSGQTAQNRAMIKVAAVHAQLAAEGLVDWTLSAIPAAASEHYAMMAAVKLAPTHGQEIDEQAAVVAEMKIRRIALAGSLGQSIATEKVAEAHEALNAQGLVSWPVVAVPAAYADVYATMTGLLLSAFVGLSRDAPSRQIDTAEWDAAVERARKMSMVAGAQARAQGQVAAIQEELNASGLVSWPADQIPASMADAFASAVSAQMQAEVGKPVDAEIVQGAYQRIRMLAMNGPAGQALAEQKVRAVHYRLAAKGRVRWTLLDIPAFAEEPYVSMAAALLAPEMMVEPNLNEAAMAERDLLQIITLPSNRQPVQAVYF